MSAPTAQLNTVDQSDLSTRDIERLRSRLEQQVRELSDKDSELRTRLAADESATPNTFVAGVEGAMATESDDEVIAMLHHEQMELVSAKEALGRIAQGDYGYCAECGDAIGLKRLEVLPDAHFCVSCQDMAEHRKGR